MLETSFHCSLFRTTIENQNTLRTGIAQVTSDEYVFGFRFYKTPLLRCASIQFVNNNMTQAVASKSASRLFPWTVSHDAETKYLVHLRLRDTKV